MLDYWDPADVENIRFAPGSNRVLAALDYAPPGLGSKLADVPIIGPQRSRAEGLAFGRLMGFDPREVEAGEDGYAMLGVVYARYNAPLNASKGIGDIFPCIDYWEVLDDFVMAVIQRSQLLAPPQPRRPSCRRSGRAVPWHSRGSRRHAPRP